MPQFPAFFDLTDRAVLVVGGGEIAARKVRLLLSSGARVTVLAPTLDRELASLAARQRLRHWAAEFSPGALADQFMIFAATGTATDVAVAQAARAQGRPVNVVDRADLSDFTVPAIVQRGDITIGIASGGQAPMLASRVRAEIEALLPARLGDLAKLAGEFRRGARQVLSDAGQRFRFWRRVFDGPVAALSLAGRQAEAREEMLKLLNRPQQVEAGAVHLVGAGPGDPDLLTAAALRALRTADVVLHDDLVAPAILERARRDARRIPVGKRKGRHSLTQAAINDLLRAEAEAGNRVVRLKAGDPFIFGRGGEEADYLARHGIAAVVVPGITAALGCAAAAGIPLTHRDLSHAVTLVTGHGKDDSDALAWTQRLQAGETVAVYMGLSEADAIRVRLLQAGARPVLPVAIIENGTRSDQRVSAGRLEDLARLAARHGDGPALLVLGEVAAKARADMLPLAARLQA